MSYKGQNGDGTSGPCPYRLVDGKEVLKDEYKTAEGKKALVDEKYVRIHVTFESQTKKINSNKKFYEAHYTCRNIYFDCSPVI